MRPPREGRLSKLIRFSTDQGPKKEQVSVLVFLGISTKEYKSDVRSEKSAYGLKSAYVPVKLWPATGTEHLLATNSVSKVLNQ